jgi:hypothetical protein
MEFKFDIEFLLYYISLVSFSLFSLVHFSLRVGFIVTTAFKFPFAIR